MIRRNIDIIAVAVLMTGMALAGHVRESHLTQRIAAQRLFIPAAVYRESVRFRQYVPVCSERL